MGSTIVLERVKNPGIVSIDRDIGRFQHELVYPRSDKSCVLDLAPPLYTPSSRTIIYDRSLYGNHGTIVGATWKRLPSGLPYLDFNGINDYVSCPTTTDASGNAFTIKTWINFNAIGRWHYVCDKSRSGTRDYDFELFISSGGTLYFRIGDGTTTERIGQGLAYSAGQWYHLVNIFDTGNWEFYLSNVLKASGVFPTVTSMALGTEPLELFRRGVSTYQYLDGKAALFKLTKGAWTEEDRTNSLNRERHLFGV